jgi:hypothetical protein
MMELRDVPAPAPSPAAKPAPAPKPAAPKPRPAAPTSYSLSAGTTFGIATSDTISTRTAKAGEAFYATVAQDVRDRSGHVVIPAGARVNGTIVEIAPAPNPSADGVMRLAVTSVTVRGVVYTVDGVVGDLETERHGRGVEGADAAKVGAGAAAGAIAGRLLGKNKKGTIIGGVVGAAAGAGVAAKTKDVDLVLPAGSHVVITLGDQLTVKAS